MANDILDILIYEYGTGGDMNLKNDDLETVTGLVNQVYIAFFGGNIEENTSDDLALKEQRNDYWGNSYLDVDNQFNSNFERTINQIVINNFGISKLEDAAKKDLAYLNDYADITFDHEIISASRLQFDVILKEPSTESAKIRFIWDGVRREIIETIVI